MNLFFLALALILGPMIANAQASQSEAFAARVDHYSTSFLGKPYISGALGEGFGYDADPLYRFDGFDCTTFVETVSALSLTKTEEDFQKVLAQIRYKDGLIDFKTRNHFTSLDWIPNNRSLFQDKTAQLFPAHVEIARTLIDKKEWYLKIHQQEDDSIPRYSEIPYLPLIAISANPALLERIPNGSILHIVRMNWGLKEKIGTDLDVSHEGFVIRKADGVLYFRHASSEKATMKVTEEPLASYLQRMTTVKTIAGINIVQIKEQTDEQEFKSQQSR